MSAMNNMIANILKDMLPEEVIELLSPERIQELGSKINEYLENQALFQSNNEKALSVIYEKLIHIEEGVNNVRSCNYSGSASRGKSAKRDSGSDSSSFGD